MGMNWICCVWLVGACGSTAALAEVTEPQALRYGQHERQVMDLYQADTAAPSPLIMVIHGGGWLHGDKSKIADRWARHHLPTWLGKGVSVAFVNYRLTTQAPLPAPIVDAARALQTLRSRAAELNLDPQRVAVTGESAGGCTALWLATHDDLADPEAGDPVLRQSTRVAGALADASQTTLEPDVVRDRVAEAALQHKMIPRAGGFQNAAEMWDGLDRQRALYRAYSPLTHLSHDDPPIMLRYANALDDPKGGIHHPRFGVVFKEKADKVGAKVYLSLRHDPDPEPTPPGAVAFLERVLLGDAE